MTEKINLEYSNQRNRQVKAVDIDYVVSNRLITFIDKWKVKFIIKKYGEEISKKILKDGSYCLSRENTKDCSRFLIFLRIKRKQTVTHNPELVLSIEFTKKGRYLEKELKIEMKKEFQDKVNQISNKERYKFPKL